MHRFLAATAIALTAIPFAADDDEPRPADAILTNARIWTVDPAQPEAQALAIFHGRILAVGSNAEIEKLAGKQTRRIDA